MNLMLNGTFLAMEQKWTKLLKYNTTQQFQEFFESEFFSKKYLNRNSCMIICIQCNSMIFNENLQQMVLAVVEAAVPKFPPQNPSCPATSVVLPVFDGAKNIFTVMCWVWA